MFSERAVTASAVSRASLERKCATYHGGSEAGRCADGGNASTVIVDGHTDDRAPSHVVRGQFFGLVPTDDGVDAEEGHRQRTCCAGPADEAVRDLCLRSSRQEQDPGNGERDSVKDPAGDAEAGDAVD